MGFARRTLAGVVALFLASVASSAHADGLFLPVAAQDAPAMPATSSGLGVRPRSSDPRAAWERHVRVARHYLASARDDAQYGETGRLVLNVRDGVRLDVVVERTAPTRWGYSLSGRVAGGGVGFVTLVVHEEAVAGSIWTPESAYELEYLGGGIHALRDVTNAPPVECGGASPPQLSATKATVYSNGQDATMQDGTTDDVAVVDILVVWMPRVEERAGGESQILSAIELNVAIANDAFERSGALVSLNLVGAEKVDYSEVVLDDNGFIKRGAHLRRLIDPDDGHMDAVHDRRDALGADLVYLESYAGSAVLGGAFAVGRGWYAFAHEIGHNFGISHERYERLPRPYEHGFTGDVVSLMSNGLECRHVENGLCTGNRQSPWYASPWRYSLSNGRPLGVTRFSKERGPRGPADAVLTINRNRHRIANFRPSRRGE